jgi:hypothetical protein
MKKTNIYLTLALAGIILAGCANPFDNSLPASVSGDGLGRALISFGNGGRTLLPYAADFYYVLDFTPGAGTDGEAFTERLSRSISKSVELAAGGWTLDLKGYIDADHAEANPDEPGLTGSAGFTVTSGQQIAVTVTLIAFQTYEGEGKFGYTISFPSNVTGAELSLLNILDQGISDLGPINLLEGASGSGDVKTTTGLETEVPSGFYRMVLDLSANIDGVPARALKTRVVRINDSLLTKAEEVLGADDFYTGALFDDLDALKGYLDALDPNDKDTPYQVGLSAAIDLSSVALRNGRDNLGNLYAALTRFVELDLSACTGSSVGPAGSGNASGRTNAPNLVTVILPPHITSISSSVFEECSNLRSINLPAGLSTIEGYAFYGCASLTSINFPASLVNLQGNSSFQMTGLSSVDLSALTITTIERNTFQGCTNLEEVKLPSGITTISQGAFDGCTSLDTLNWGDLTNTLVVQMYAFRGTAFDALSLNRFRTLDAHAFANMEKLETVDLTGYTGTSPLPATLFIGCDNLEKVKIPENLTATFAYNTFPPQATYEIVPAGSGGYEVFENGNMVVKDHVIIVASSALSGTLTMDSSITGIGEYAFLNSQGLTAVDLSGCTGLTTIGQRAFSDAAALATVTFPTTLQTIGNNAFSGATSLSSVTFPATLQTIGNNAFYGATGLNSVNLAACTALTSIGNSAFKNTALTSVTFPASLQSIGNDAFDDATALNSVNLAACTALTSIGDNAFRNTALTSVTFPASLQTIGGYAFSGTTALTSSVTLPASLQSIGVMAFQNSGITSVDMSGCTTYTTINEMAFHSATSLQSVDFPPNLQSIGDDAFRNTALVSVELPATLKSIGQRAFQEIAALVWVKWPTAPSAATVGLNAFYNAANLTRVELPAQMSTGSDGIGNRAFLGTKLEILILRADMTGLNNGATVFPDKTFTIYVPDSEVSAYKAAYPWSSANLIDKIESINNLQLEDGPTNW